MGTVCLPACRTMKTLLHTLLAAIFFINLSNCHNVTCPRHMTKDIMVHPDTVSVFTTDRHTERCAAYYTPVGGCESVSVHCARFFLPNRDPTCAQMLSRGAS